MQQALATVESMTTSELVTNPLPQPVRLPNVVKTLMMDGPAMDETSPERLVKSKKRVADHGEVFTPSWMVEEMLDLVKSESDRIDARFLEPACGSGNFLKVVLVRKLRTVDARYKKSLFEVRHHALLALMGIYGIELLCDNVEECRQNLIDVVGKFHGFEKDAVWMGAAHRVLEANVIHGDALTLRQHDGAPIEFPEWSYLGAGKFQRRDFRFHDLTERANFVGGMFDLVEEPAIFTPIRTYAPMTIQEISK